MDNDYLTPVEKVNDLYFKRDDLFIPIEGSPVNGSKLRQLIYLLTEAKEKGFTGAIAGAVSQSPQHIMMAAVCKNLGLKCALVVGTKNIEKFPILNAAQNLGAEFHSTNIGYAMALQAKAFQLQREVYGDYFVVETNITLSEKLNSAEKIRNFHLIGATQTKNIPDEIDTLILPCGSCNSATSALYGLYLYGYKNIKNIILVGIGSFGSKDINYLIRRLNIIDPESTKMLSKINEEEDSKISLIYYDLHAEKYCKYEDWMPYNYGEIEFHPRYEGKIMNYLFEKNILDNIKYKNILFWIVGSEPR